MVREQWYYNYEVEYWSEFDYEKHRSKGIVAGTSYIEALSMVLAAYQEGTDGTNIDRIVFDIIDDSDYVLESSEETIKHE